MPSETANDRMPPSRPTVRDAVPAPPFHERAPSEAGLNVGRCFACCYIPHEAHNVRRGKVSYPSAAK